MSASTEAFKPQGKSIFLVTDSPPPLGVQVPVDDEYKMIDHTTKGSGMIRVANLNNHHVCLAYGSTPEEAQARAVTPTELITAQYAIPIMANTVSILCFPLGSYFSAKSATKSNMFLTPGQGI